MFSARQRVRNLDCWHKHHNSSGTKVKRRNAEKLTECMLSSLQQIVYSMSTVAPEHQLCSGTKLERSNSSSGLQQYFRVKEPAFTAKFLYRNGVKIAHEPMGADGAVFRKYRHKPENAQVRSQLQ